MKNYYDKTWKIGELAKVFDVNVQLLRHYDKEGLLVPDIRNPDNKWRTYRYVCIQWILSDKPQAQFLDDSGSVLIGWYSSIRRYVL